MNSYQIPFFSLLAGTLVIIFGISSCQPEEPINEPYEPTDYGYAIDINSPLPNTIYQVNDTIPISIDFKSETGEIVHYLAVQIYQSSDSTNSIYSVTAHQHVPDLFSYNDICVLKDTSKISAGENWTIEAALWSHEIDPDTIRLTKAFKIVQ